MLTMARPTVPVYHPDQYALNVLAALLTDGKTAPFYKVLAEEAKVAPSVNASQDNEELAGRWDITVRAFDGTPLDTVHAAVERAFARFKPDGIQQEELAWIKARYESSFYSGVSSVIGKAFQLAQCNIFAGNPGFAAEDLRRTLAVTAYDLMRVYRKYIKGRHHVTMSFVPRDEASLALAGSSIAEVVVESIVAGAEAEIGKNVRGERRTASAIDRSVEPPFGRSPSLKAPGSGHAAPGQ